LLSYMPATAVSMASVSAPDYSRACRALLAFIEIWIYDSRLSLV
jgi:hypothetical protein